MRDVRAESPPPGAILTTEMLLQRSPPPAPARQRRHVQCRTSIDQRTRSSPFFPPLLLDDNGDINDNGDSSSDVCILPCWRLPPRRLLFCDELLYYDSDCHLANRLAMRHLHSIVSYDESTTTSSRSGDGELNRPTRTLSTTTSKRQCTDPSNRGPSRD